MKFLNNKLLNQRVNIYGKSFSRADLFIILFILIGEIARFIVPFIHNPINALWSDPGRWWKYASTGIQVEPLTFMDPIFYQMWLSFVAKFTLEIPELTGLYAALLSASMPWLWYRFFRELLPSKRTAMIGWALIACLPSWIGIYSYFMTETLLLNLLGLSLWMSWRSKRKRDVASFALAAFFWCLAGLTRGIAAPLAAAVTIFVWLRMDKKIASAMAASVIIILILGVLSYRSYVQTGMVAPLGQPHINRIYAESGKEQIIINYYSSGSNLHYQYNWGSSSIQLAPLEPFSDWGSSRVGSGDVTVMIDLDNLSESWALAKHKVDMTKPPVIPLLMENIIYIFFGPSWPDINKDHFFELMSIWSRFIWAPLFIIAIVLLIQMIRRGEGENARPLLAALILWFLIQGLSMISINEGRYRKPIEGFIITAVLLGISSRSRLRTQEKEN